MILLLIISSVLLISSTEAVTKDELLEMRKDCKKETGVKEEQLESLITAGTIEESNRAAGDYVKCVSFKLDFLKSDGSLEKDNIKKYLLDGGMSEDAVKKTIEECDNVEKSEDLTLLVIRFANCYYKLIPKELRTAE